MDKESQSQVNFLSPDQLLQTGADQKQKGTVESLKVLPFGNNLYSVTDPDGKRVLGGFTYVNFRPAFVWYEGGIAKIGCLLPSLRPEFITGLTPAEKKKWLG